MGTVWWIMGFILCVCHEDEIGDGNYCAQTQREIKYALRMKRNVLKVPCLTFQVIKHRGQMDTQLYCTELRVINYF